MVSGQLHDLAALLPGKRVPSIRWTPQPSWAFSRRESNPGRSGRS